MKGTTCGSYGQVTSAVVELTRCLRLLERSKLGCQATAEERSWAGCLSRYPSGYLVHRGGALQSPMTKTPISDF
jgi:hypothetical protein